MKFPKAFPPVARLNPPPAEAKLPNVPVTSPCGCVTPSPERVVTTITTLVLSPYSAVGAPWITSIDCTESMGIWIGSQDRRQDQPDQAVLGGRRHESMVGYAGEPAGCRACARRFVQRLGGRGGHRDRRRRARRNGR